MDKENVGNEFVEFSCILKLAARYSSLSKKEEEEESSAQIGYVIGKKKYDTRVCCVEKQHFSMDHQNYITLSRVCSFDGLRSLQTVSVRTSAICIRRRIHVYDPFYFGRQVICSKYGN